MNFFKNRTVLGVICIAVALVICFLITPLFNASASKTTEIICMKNDVRVGQEITEKDIETVTVGAYNLPSDIIRTSDEIVGKYVASELLKGEYVLVSKISDTPANENNYLYGLTGEKRAISITIPTFAKGLSGKLQSGDIVSIIACDYRESGETVVPDELQYVEEAGLPSSITLLVSPMQANILAELESNGEIHIELVYRGDAENSSKFIEAQEKVLGEIEERLVSEESNEEKNEGPDSEEEPPAESSEEENEPVTEEYTDEAEENADAELSE